MRKPVPNAQGRPCHPGENLRIHGLVQAMLLLRLGELPRHGYALFKLLNEELPDEMVPDVAVVYRILRDLESQGHVNSRLAPGDGGPARKVYELTPSGEHVLAVWYGSIRTRMVALTRFLEAYEQTELRTQNRSQSASEESREVTS